MCNETPQPRLDPQGRDLDAPAVYIVQRAILGFAWACAPKSFDRDKVEKTLDAIGEIYCPGTPWTVLPREHADSEFQSPGLCIEDSNRQHWLLCGGATGLMFLANGAAGGADGIPENIILR